MKKLSLLLLMAMLVIGLLAACGQGGNGAEQPADTNGGEAGEKKVLKMGTSADYAPFEFVDTAKGEEIIGFDIDLANAIADKLGYELDVQDIDFNGLVEALKSEKIDVVLSGMTPTEKRMKSVDFSDVYYSANHMIVTKKDSGIEAIEDLTNKKIGVQLGSIQEEKAVEIKGTVDLTIESRNRIPELVQEIKAGRFDGAIIEDLVAKKYLDKNEDLTGFTIPSDEENGFAVALPKGNEELVAQFNQAIQEMKENGELDSLVNKWFGGEE